MHGASELPAPSATGPVELPLHLGCLQMQVHVLGHVHPCRHHERVHRARPVRYIVLPVGHHVLASMCSAMCSKCHACLSGRVMRTLYAGFATLIHVL